MCQHYKYGWTAFNETAAIKYIFRIINNSIYTVQKKFNFSEIWGCYNLSMLEFIMLMTLSL